MTLISIGSAMPGITVRCDGLAKPGFGVRSCGPCARLRVGTATLFWNGSPRETLIKPSLSTARIDKVEPA